MRIHSTKALAASAGALALLSAAGCSSGGSGNIAAGNSPGASTDSMSSSPTKVPNMAARPPVGVFPAAHLERAP